MKLCGCNASLLTPSFQIFLYFFFSCLLLFFNIQITQKWTASQYQSHQTTLPFALFMASSFSLISSYIPSFACNCCQVFTHTNHVHTHMHKNIQTNTDTCISMHTQWIKTHISSETVLYITLYYLYIRLVLFWYYVIILSLLYH